MILGVEVREDAVIAVAADENGAITRRGRHDGANGSSAAAAIRVVLADASPSSVGVAVRDPLEHGVTDVVAAISAAAGRPGSPRIVTRGCALALAESWRGAAKDAHQVMALTAGDAVHSGLVIDGVPFEGAHGRAGAAAWLALNPVERED